MNNPVDYLQFRNAEVPAPWAKIIGLAHIALVREGHPEEREKEQT